MNPTLIGLLTLVGVVAGTLFVLSLVEASFGHLRTTPTVLSRRWRWLATGLWLVAGLLVAATVGAALYAEIRGKREATYLFLIIGGMVIYPTYMAALFIQRWADASTYRKARDAS
jgi:ABC-type Na+ efflux pump permease subunit